MNSSFSSLAMIGIEVGLLRGLETMKWVLDSLQHFIETTAISTIVQCNATHDRSCLRVVVKASTNLTAEQLIQELISLEYEYNERIRDMEPIRCFLLTFDHQVSLAPGMVLPHPQMTDHSSWLYCAWETARNYRHPVLDQSLEKLISKINLSDIVFYSQGKSVITKLAIPTG
jgi:7,8-dihydro-6-hydroxymethylpterin-pyrophosphokinase